MHTRLRPNDGPLDEANVERALQDLEDDYHRTGELASQADVDRASERHGLSLLEHAELLQRATAARLAVEAEDEQPDAAPVRPRRLVTDDLDSFDVFLRDVGRYPLLAGREEVELARAIETGARAEEQLDTSSGLPEEQRVVLRSLAERGRQAKQRFVACNVRLVVSNARSFRGQGLDFPDLVQAGTLGLIRAAEKFDWRKGFKFSTYATWWIRQSIARQLADTGRVVRLPVHVVERVNRLRRTSTKLEQRRGRPPSLDELSESLGWEPAEIAFLQDVSHDALSLDAPLASQGDGSTLADVISCGMKDVELEAIEGVLADDVDKALDVLDSRHRLVLIRRYGLDGEPPRTLEEVGRELSVTRERVRQIEQQAKECLRTVLIEHGYGPQ